MEAEAVALALRMQRDALLLSHERHILKATYGVGSNHKTVRTVHVCHQPSYRLEGQRRACCRGRGQTRLHKL